MNSGALSEDETVKGSMEVEKDNGKQQAIIIRGWLSQEIYINLHTS